MYRLNQPTNEAPLFRLNRSEKDCSIAVDQSANLIY